MGFRVWRVCRKPGTLKLRNVALLRKELMKTSPAPLALARVERARHASSFQMPRDGCDRCLIPVLDSKTGPPEVETELGKPSKAPGAAWSRILNQGLSTDAPKFKGKGKKRLHGRRAAKVHLVGIMQ